MLTHKGGLVLGLWDLEIFEGEKGERVKINFLQTFPPNPALFFCFFALHLIL